VYDDNEETAIGSRKAAEATTAATPATDGKGTKVKLVCVCMCVCVSLCVYVCLRRCTGRRHTHSPCPITPLTLYLFIYHALSVYLSISQDLTRNEMDAVLIPLYKEAVQYSVVVLDRAFTQPQAKPAPAAEGTETEREREREK
jgi:hypothetical protein